MGSTIAAAGLGSDMNSVISDAASIRDPPAAANGLEEGSGIPGTAATPANGRDRGSVIPAASAATIPANGRDRGSVIPAASAAACRHTAAAASDLPPVVCVVAAAAAAVANAETGVGGWQRGDGEGGLDEDGPASGRSSSAFSSSLGNVSVWMRYTHA